MRLKRQCSRNESLSDLGGSSSLICWPIDRVNAPTMASLNSIGEFADGCISWLVLPLVGSRYRIKFPHEEHRRVAVDIRIARLLL